MLVPVGKITEDDKISAVIVYDIKDRERKLISIKELYSIAKNGGSVFGVFIYIKSDGKAIAMREKDYIWDNIPECNGRCIPEVDADKSKLVVLGSCNSREKKGYVVVDVFGHVKVLSRADMQKEVQSQNVIGAKMRKNGRLAIYINYSFDNSEITKLGYRLEGNNWTTSNNKEGKGREE